MTTLLITGTTGFVGSRLLLLALASPDLARVISVTRRPLKLPSTQKNNPKLQEVVIPDDQDWLEWPSTAIEKVGWVDGCVWCQGITPSKGTDIDLTRKISVDYVQAGLRALLAGRERYPCARSEPKPLHFVLLSGSMAVRDQKANLWLLDEFRKIRGAGETAALAFQDEKGRAVVEVSIARCGKIVAADVSWLESLSNKLMEKVIGLPILPVNDLIECLLQVALKGTEKTTLENEDLRLAKI